MYGLDDVTLLSERFFEFDRVSTSACMEENIELACAGDERSVWTDTA